MTTQTGYSTFNQFDIQGIYLYRDELIDQEDMVDIKSMVIETNIYEDMIESNSMSAILVLVDTFNIIDRYPIIGGEKVRIVFSTATDTLQTAEFIVYKIGTRKRPDDSSIAQSYMLYLCSVDRYNDAHMNVSRAFKGSWDTIVSQHLLELNSKRPIEVSQSEGVHEWITPFWTPLQTCKYIAKRAFNSNGAPFFFYETMSGYKFRSLSDLYLQEPATKLFIEPKQYTYNQNDAEKSLNSVLQWEIGNSLDRLRMLHERASGSDYMVIDFESFNVSQHKFDYKNSFETNTIPHLEEFPFPDSDQTVNNLMTVVMYREDQSHVNEMNRNSSRVMLDALKLSVIIPGNSRLEAGMIVELDIPSMAGDAQGMSDNVSSGKWLITSLRHKITLDNYICALELVKDSTKELITPTIK